MPSEYEALVAALKLTDIPFAEYGWKARPEGTYGVVQLEFEAAQLDGGDAKADRVFEGSIDVFFTKLADRADVIGTVEEILAEILGNSWEMNSSTYENNTGLFHIEWAFQCQNSAEEGE